MTQWNDHTDHTDQTEQPADPQVLRIYSALLRLPPNASLAQPVPTTSWTCWLAVALVVLALTALLYGVLAASGAFAGMGQVLPPNGLYI